MIAYPKEEEISLYIHIPFCTRKCGYCHFFVIKDDEKKKEELLNALLVELSLYAHLLKEKKLVTIYFGGGTPSLFGAERLKKVLDAIDSYSPFQTDDVEITLEANPESLTKEVLKSYKDSGINRLSIGVQSLDDQELRLLTRTHTSLEAIKAIEAAHALGIVNLSIDLMYEIPGQTNASWQKTLNQAAKLPISHISLYNMTIEQDTAFYRKKNALLPLIPKEQDSKKMLEQLSITLKKNGFTQYEISAFCRDECYSKHNTGYWTGRPFIGLGPSSFSFLPPQRFQNVPNFVRYLEAIRQKELPVTFKETLEPEARLRELFVVEIRLFQGVDKLAFQKRYGMLPQSFWEELNVLLNQGLVEENSSRILLTEKGRTFYDTVASSLISA